MVARMNAIEISHKSDHGSPEYIPRICDAFLNSTHNVSNELSGVYKRFHTIYILFIYQVMVTFTISLQTQKLNIRRWRVYSNSGN